MSDADANFKLVSLKLESIVKSSQMAAEERTVMRDDNTIFKNDLLKVTDDMRVDVSAKLNDIARQNSIIEDKVFQMATNIEINRETNVK